MAFHANLHNVLSMVPMSDPTGNISWLDIRDDIGNEVGIFMPMAVAERIAAAFVVGDAAVTDERFTIGGTTYIGGAPTRETDYTDANLSDFDDGNITP